jgi:ACS family glucarate transporter-like MFS transporter/ACS family D-galactonate transporter-like MFS transporter
MQIGAITASLLTGTLILAIGWRITFAVYAGPGFLWAIAFWLRFRNTPDLDPVVNEQERLLIGHQPSENDGPVKGSGPTPWHAIATSPSIWFLCGQQMCRAAGYMFFASWFPTFLQETRDVSVKDSGYLQAVVFTGTLVGCICGGLLTDWIWRRTGDLRLSRSGVGATFLLSCAALIALAWSVDNTFLAVGLLALGALSSALCGPCAYSAAIDIGGDYVPHVFGLMNMAGNLAAAACPVLVAELFDWTDDWRVVLIGFAAVYFVGAVCWALVDSRTSVSA